MTTIMTKKSTGVLLITLLVAMSFSPFITGVTAVVNTSSHNNVVIDGVIGSDWTDGNYTVRLDPDQSSWGADWGLDGLYFALNDTGIFLGLKITLAGPANQFNVFIDTDAGNTGITDYSTVPTYGKSLKFVSDGFVPNLVLLSDEGNWASPWSLLNFTDETGNYANLTTGFVASTLNETSFDGTWGYGIPMTFEAFIPYDLLYPAGIPADAELRFFAAMIGGNPGDVIPDQYGGVENDEYHTYVAVKIADEDGDPKLIPYTLGWSGENPDGSYTSAKVNDKDGNVTLGLDMEFYYEMWYTDSHSEFMNNSQWPTLNITYYNSTSMTNTSYEVMMYHESGDMAGANEIYRYTIPLMVENGYSVGDKFYWFIYAGNVNATVAKEYYSFENGISPMPPIDLGFIGAVTPAGGFKDPDESFEVEVQIEQLWNGTDKVTFDVMTDVNINYTLNDTGSWLLSPMTYDSPSSDNAIFKGSLGPFPNGTLVEFYIIAENNNTVQTGPFLIHIGIEPPKSIIFNMSDPQGDEWGTYPTNAAFGPGVGLFDLLQFNVSANAYGTSFDFRLLDSYDPGWGAGNFSHQMFVVLIDMQPGGTTEGVLKSNIKVQDEYPWDIGFYGDGWMSRYFTPETIASPQTDGTGITTGYQFINGEHWFNLYIPETLIHTVANSSWKYYVMVASADFNDFRNHLAENGEWNFGGGDDSAYDPNYCDILVPTADDPVALQETISTGYDVGAQQYATLLAVGDGLSFEVDTTNPVVEITSPSDGTNLTISSGTTIDQEITWTVEDPAQGTFAGISEVKVYVNGVLVPEAGEGNSATLALSAGENIIRVVATDKSGNAGYDEITINVASATADDTATDDTATDDTSTDDSSGGLQIPGYSVGIMILALFGSAVILLRKRK